MWKYRLPCRFEQTVGFIQTGFEERQVVIIDIGVPLGTDLDGLIAPAAKAGAVTVLAALCADLCARLGFAGVERRVDVDQVDGSIRQGLQEGQVVTKVDTVGHGRILTGYPVYMELFILITFLFSKSGHPGKPAIDPILPVTRITIG